MMTQKLAIDVGGTFTDVAYINDQTGEISFTKTPSSPVDPSDGVLKGIDKIVNIVGTRKEDIDYFIHGTTYATNAFLENNGSSVALITTEGFRDVIEIGRQKRTKLYDLFQDNPSSIVERQNRYGIKERVNAKGEIISPLNEEDVKESIREIKSKRINSIAVIYLHSYANPEHEIRTAELIREVFPECHVSLSHEISPEFREYERTMTTVINAYLKPSTNNYFQSLANKLTKSKVQIPHIVKSNGGAMSMNKAGERVVETLLSGPAGGVVGATYLAKKMDIQNIITLDMGGTSTDVAMILKQEPKTTLESLFKGYPLKVPMIEMETVGAGGGSIGWIDHGNLLKVGPKSAGAIPGPACYGNGGVAPTITDANLVLGRIDPDSFHNGEMKLNRAAAEKAFETIMQKTGKSLEEAALGVIEIANHHMAEAVRLVTIRKGYDPKEFTLFSFGGASPLHASEIAKALRIPKVVIPSMSSEMSAFGFLAADIRHDFATTKLTALADESLPKIIDTFKGLKAKGEELLSEEGVSEQDRVYFYKVDLRYKGQAFEISININLSDLHQIKIAELQNDFYREYERQYGYSNKNEVVEIVNYRLSAIGLSSEVNLKEIEAGNEAPSRNAIKEVASVYLNSLKKQVDVPIFNGHLLKANNQIKGPAIIDGMNTTIFMEVGDTAEIDRFGNLTITTKEGEE